LRDQTTGLTEVLQRVVAGENQATEELLPLVYDELRKEAAKQMSQERANHTLQATALVHDAYLKLVGGNESWDSIGHFYAAAALAMRRILIDHARSKARLKRGGNRVQLEFTELNTPDKKEGISAEELLELDDALQKLEKQDQQVADLVRLRLYAGLSVTDAAKTLHISRSVAYERWEYACCWFQVEMAND